MRTVVVSDLHLGSLLERDVLRRPEALEALAADLDRMEIKAPANGQVVVPVSTLEAAIATTPAAAHYIVTVHNQFIGYIQHLLDNARVGVFTDMSTVCTFPALTVAVPTNPSGV